MKLSKIEKLQVAILRCLREGGEQNANDIGLYCERQLGYNPRDHNIANTHKALRPLTTMKAVKKIPQTHPKPYRYHIISPVGETILLYLETMEEDGKKKISV